MTKEEVKNKVFLNEDKLNEVSDKTIQDYEEFIKFHSADRNGCGNI